MFDDKFHALSELIDAAALDERRWPEVVRRVASASGAVNGALVRQNHVSGHAQALDVDLDPAARDLYVNYYLGLNVFRHHSELEDAFGRRAVTVRPEVRDILTASEYYNDFLRRFDMAHLAWIFLDREGSDVAVLSFGRPTRREAFDAPEVSLLTRVMPRLMRSYQISRRLGGVGATLEDYLAPRRDGVVLLDLFGRVMHANPAAEAIIGSADGLRFAHHGLAADDPYANARLAAAIHQAGTPGGQLRVGLAVTVPRPSGLRPFAVEVCPLGDIANAFLFGRPSVLVEIRDLAAADPSADARLTAGLDLTRAEARVAGLLLSGLGSDKVAKTLGVSINTVRVHLGRMMRKTSTHRQAELIQVLDRVANPNGRSG